mgnify:CR=1 FL=1
MIYKNAYDTTFGSLDNSEALKQYLNTLNNITSTSISAENKKILYARGLNIYYITPFTNQLINTSEITLKNPYYLETEKEENVIITDIRPFVNEARTLKEGELVTSNNTELNTAFVRTILNAFFIKDMKSFEINFRFANTVYAAWMSDTITKRFGLNTEEQLKVFVIAYYFYNSLFSNSSIKENDKHILASKYVVEASRTSAKFVLDVAEKLTDMNSIIDFINNVKEIIPNKRLEDLNLGVLLTILSTTWYGTFSKEIISVSLEHVPSFTAIVGVSSTQRFYKKSMIANIAERYGKGGKLENFITNLNKTLSDKHD